MKVFISWSGARSKKIALLFRDWLPTVIQALEPFVSSEDIEKGSRWNTEIAQELKESTFGIICVTKDNLQSPWLNFEAGALSKIIDNNHVAPLLFDIKPSELTNSPISQFQATSFNRDDMKRLVETLNIAAGSCLTSSRLDKAFELCYPDLEKNVDSLREELLVEYTEDAEVSPDTTILEELLEITRNTQRLIGNTDAKLHANMGQVQEKIDDVVNHLERQRHLDMRFSSPALKSRALEDIVFHSVNNESGIETRYRLLMILSLFKNNLPWLYDAGRELVHILDTDFPSERKLAAITKFKNIMEFTFDQPMARRLVTTQKNFMILFGELTRCIEQIQSDIDI